MYQIKETLKEYQELNERMKNKELNNLLEKYKNISKEYKKDDE